MEIISAFIEHWGALIIAAASLVIAVVSLVKSSKAQKTQNRINDLELKIKQYELERIQAEKSAESASCVEARIIKLAKDTYKLKVWNSGNTTVYEVAAEIDKDAKIIVCNSGLMPFEVLESKKSFDVNVIVHMGSARKFNITTTWKDASGEEKEKVQLCSI